MEKGDRTAGTDHVVVATASSPWLRSAFSTGVTSCSSMATSDRRRGVLVHPRLKIAPASCPSSASIGRGTFYSSRHGDCSGQRRSASVAQEVGLSWWHEIQGFGILYWSVMAGVMNRNV